jgi:hypothetical protein
MTSTLTQQTPPPNQGSASGATNRIFKPPNENYINIAKTLRISNDEFLSFKVLFNL